MCFNGNVGGAYKEVSPLVDLYTWPGGKCLSAEEKCFVVVGHLTASGAVSEREEIEIRGFQDSTRRE
jgi:hypothetical protein